MRTLIFMLLSLSYFHGLSAQAEGEEILVKLFTGSDDLRGGNNAYIKLNLTNNTSSKEYPLGGGFGQNGNNEVTIKLDGLGSVRLDQIRSVTIRHDGSPRSGQPFDTYDNWDLQAIEVSLIDFNDGGNPKNIYNTVNDRRVRGNQKRFTGQARTLTLYKQ
jgi:hypothetical protein